MFITPPSKNFAANVAHARQKLHKYTQFTPTAFAARRRRQFISILDHHYLAPSNDTYRKTVQSTGVDLPIRKRSPFRWFSGSASSQAQLHFPARMPLADILALLPITDKQILFAGSYQEHPAVSRDLIRFVPATSGTTTGKRAQLPLTFTGLWAPSMEPMIWYLLLYGIDPLTTNGYTIAHFLHQQPEEQRNFATYAAFSAFQNMASDRIHMGSTQDTLDQHIAELTRPAQWALAAPTFYRTVALRASASDLARMQLHTIFWGASPLSKEDDELTRAKFKLRHSLGVYVSTEGGYIGIQLAEHAPYVVPTDRLIIEIVDEHGLHVAPGETGDVLITSLVHDAAPILRYKIGDKARYLGHPMTNADLWHDLNLIIPTKQTISPLGKGLLRHGMFLDSVTRSGGLLFGAMKLAYEDVAKLQDEMGKRGTPAPMLQIAKCLTQSGNPSVVVRLEAPAERADEYRANMLEVLKMARQLDYYFTTGELPPPTIAIFAPGELSAGRFKVPPLIDETVTREE